MDYNKLNEERISSTKIYAYDQITAISQKAINKQLANMYKANKTLKKISATLADDDYAGLFADLDPPEIELQLGTDNRAVYYFIKLKSGTLKYWKGYGPKAQQASCSVRDWVLALHVNLAFELAAFTNLPQDVKDRLKKLNDYSVQQLLIDFTSANIANYDAARSKIDLPSGDTAAESYWKLFMNDYFAELAKNKNDSVIHYLPKVTEAQKGYPVPTLPPTDLTFQNLPFVKSASDLGRVGENTMLVYLQMTGGHTMPRELLPVSANWVVPAPDSYSASYDGTVALSKTIFAEGWLLPALVEFNKRSTWIVDEAWWRSKDVIYVQYKLAGHMGWWDAKPGDLQWKAVETKDVDQKAKDKVKNAPGKWYKYHNRNGKDDDEGLFRVYEWGTTTNWCFLPEGYNENGKCEITVMGTTDVDLYVHIDLPRSTGWLKGEWSVNLIFDGVKDGELIIKADPIVPVVSHGADEAWLRDGDVTRFFDSVKRGLNSLSMQDVLNRLTGAFSDGWIFCFAGGGDFYIDKAVFNREQDLLCQLKYKFKA
ncbi:hypothetical protein AcV5_003389 [Taiwanofungus camphoratus]|nr:hypothetical protein AcV5_003389 [Antrodia cinnamomea]